MPDYLIVIEDPDAPTGWRVTQLVRDVPAGQIADEVRQGYVGEGHYAACPWDDRLEFDMAPGEMVAVKPSAAPVIGP